MFLSACATLPPDGPSQGEARIVERIDRLEGALLEHCGFDDVRSRAGLAAIGELRSRVQTLQEQVVARDQDPERVDCPAPLTTDTANDKLVLGRAEWIGLPTLGSYFKARLDTGANTSSLSADEITPFERDGEDWVRFRLSLSDRDAVVPGIRDREIEARVVRRVRILQASGSDSRPVIALPMTLGTLEQTVEFTLNDRAHLSYPVLLGRRFLMDQAVVDVSRSYTFARPEFPGGETADEAADDQHDDDLLEP
ncbi:ATP-dependent zinc protease family protein [Pseudazoarcus pumilus]|nr:ATP-dependent zinc protease [Pseudazoarcus pumilus]